MKTEYKFFDWIVPPRIVAAAIYYKPTKTVYWQEEPARHHHLLSEMSQDIDKEERQYDEEIQGFLTSDGVFVDRETAMKFAEYHKQLKVRSPDGYNGCELFSEDLW